MVVVALLSSFVLSQTQKPVPSIPYQWKNVEIVGGGFVIGIITHPKAKDVMYARTDIGGAYRWNPKTSRWTPIEDFITRSDWNLYGTESVAIDPSDPKRVYIAAGTYTNEWGQNGAILRSKDQGNNWERINLPFKNGGNEDGRSIGERLNVDPNDGHVIYFGTRNEGLLRSNDYGSTWKKVDSFPITGRTNRIGVGWVEFDPKSSNHGQPSQTIYAGTTGLDQNLYVSKDSGATWSAVPGQPAKLWPHHVKQAADGTLYLCYCNAAGPNGVSSGAVYKFDHHSGTFSNITPEETGPSNTFGYGGITLDAENPNVVMVSTLDRWAKHDTVFRSTNKGISWMNLSAVSKRDSTKAKYLDWGRKEPEFGHWIGDVEIDPFNSNRAWYVTGATIWGTDNLTDADKGKPVNWVPRAEGLEETAVLDLVSPPEGPHLISALGDISGFSHMDLTKSPTAEFCTNGYWSTTYDVDYAGQKPLSIIRLGGQNLEVSHDGGVHWKLFKWSPMNNQRFLRSATISADGKVILVDGFFQLLWTDDDGETMNYPTGIQTSGTVIADRINPNYFYVHNNKNGDLWFSKDAGKSFSVVTNKFPTTKGKIYPSPNEEGVIWIPLDKGLAKINLKTDDYATLSPDQYIEQIAFGKAAPGTSTPTAFCIGKINGVEGIFRSLDGCNTWQRINDAKTGFGTMERVEGDPRIFGRVYIGTNGRGILYGDIK